MDIKIIIPLLALTLLGLFLLGSGITGMVISESCCLGTGCSPENMCDVAKPHLEIPGTINSRDTFLGLGMILLSISLFIVLNMSETAKGVRLGASSQGKQAVCQKSGISEHTEIERFPLSEHDQEHAPGFSPAVLDRSP